MPLGMEDHRILSGHLRASSSYNYNHGPDRARLNIYNGHGRTGAWVAKYRNANQWLQIDLRIMSIIKGIATQGRREAHQWVKSYTLSYSTKGLRFRPYVAYGKVKVRWWINVYDNFSTCQLFLAFFDIEISNSCYMDLYNVLINDTYTHYHSRCFCVKNSSSWTQLYFNVPFDFWLTLISRLCLYQWN